MQPDPEVTARVAELVGEVMPQARAEAYKVWQRAPHALELDELHAIALKGLAEASARWQQYCHEKGHDPRAFEYFPAYCLARMRGAMLDNLRSQDWVTRSDRTRAKLIRDAGQDRGASEAELAAATGLTVAEVRSTLAAVSARPVSIDAEPHDVAAEADVESQAMVLRGARRGHRGDRAAAAANPGAAGHAVLRWPQHQRGCGGPGTGPGRGGPPAHRRHPGRARRDAEGGGLMPQRVQPTEDPAAIAGHGAQGEPGHVTAGPDPQLRQLAGALAALAGRVDRLDARVSAGLQPKVTVADRSKALEQAREFVADLMTKPASEAERVANEVAVARYLTGE